MESTLIQKIPLVDLKAQYADLKVEIDAAMQHVIDQTSFIMGPDVAAFEAEFADFCGADECVGVSSGTAALILALRAVGVQPGDEVITAAHTFIATAEAISAVGAVPVFVDISPATFTMEPAAVAQAVTSRTRAIIPVHLYGHPANMEQIRAIADGHDLAVIDDAAQAHGARRHGQPVGALGDICCYSFYPGKNLGAYGDAGAVTTNRPELAQRVRLLRDHGRRSKYVHEETGFGERLDTLQAAVLRVKLAHLADWTARRRALAARYTALLTGCGLDLPVGAADAEPVWHLYVVRTPQREALLHFLRNQGIGAGIHYPVPLHLQPAYAHLGYRRGDLPVTEAVADSCLSLPLFPEMTDAQQEYVAQVVRQFHTGNAGIG